MTSLTRSKSAPQFDARPDLKIDTLSVGSSTPTPGRRSRASRRSRQRSALTAVSSPLLSPLATPRVEREDPFNLTGFFPTHVSTLVEEEEWNWLRQEEEEFQGANELLKESRGSLFSPVELGANSSLPTTPKTVNSELEEEARKVIEEEDKLGVLRIHELFVTRPGSYSDDRLLSPYSDEQPVNDDALYNGLCALRRAYDVPSDVRGLESGNLGGLFMPAADEEAVQSKQAADSWTSSFYQGLRMLW